MADLIVGERLEVDAHPIVLIGAFVFQNDWRAAELRDDKIGLPLPVQDRQQRWRGAGKVYGVEARTSFVIVGPTSRAEIAQQPNFTAVFVSPTATRSTQPSLS